MECFDVMKIPMWLSLIAALLFTDAFAAERAAAFLRKPPEWFRSNDGKRVGESILSWQSERGDWPKNTNTTVKFEGDRAKLKGTFDNGATIPELRFLAQAFSATKEGKYEKAFLRGLDHVLAAQYANGGWPQSSPVGKGYDRHITFNDQCMINIMNFVRDVSWDETFSFVDAERRQKARRSFDKGIECILKCQIRADGKLTAWCAQHDEVDFSPRPARTFELASFSGGESAGIVRFLMTLEKPNREVVEAVDAAVKWFEAVKLTGIKEVLVDDPNAPKGKDKRVVEDPNAPPIWARFYDLKTMKPIFVDRDGAPKAKLSEIGYERRNGYAWLGTWPAAVLKEYPAWRKRVER